MNVILLRSVAAIFLAGISAGAFAQAVDESALDDLDRASPKTVPVIREAAGAVELRNAMRRIAEQPNDADALADAGNAALTLDDANAALNFLTRANALRPRNGRITSALASATVRTENPFEALRLFDDAVRLGISERSIAADRALAFDLLGNFARAQQDYNLARTTSVSDRLVVNQAISLSLLGQKNEADGMLLPLLKKNDPAAWRARAFMLAARGDSRESTKVTQGFMDARSAQKMERYLRLMPNLTGAQQAAAIHLGHFPAYNIGRDSAEIKRVAATIPTPQPARTDSRLIPSGEPLGRKASKAEAKKAAKKANVERERTRDTRVAAVKPTKVERETLSTNTARALVDEARLATSTVVRPGALPPPEAARPLMRVALPSSPAASALKAQTMANATQAPLPSLKTPQPTASAQPKPVPTLISVSSSPAVPGPNGTATPVGSIASDAVKAPSITATSVQTSARAFDLAAIVGAIEIPEDEQKPSAVPVDLNKIKLAAAKAVVADAAKIAKPDAKAAVKAAPHSNPARFWVQIGTGGASALGFDYRRLEKKYPALFKGQKGWTSTLGRTDKLLVGPFADLKASKKWEADYKKAGGDGFSWKSDTGVVVTALNSK